MANLKSSTNIQKTEQSETAFKLPFQFLLRLATALP